MADIYGSHFEYGAISSRQYGLIIASVDTNRINQLSGKTESVTIFNKAARKRYLINDDLSGSPLSIDIEIITDDERPIDHYTRRNIEKWLFNRHNYRKLYLDIDDDYLSETYEYVNGVIKRNYINCRFINPEKLEYNGGIVGYKATLEADSDMFWQDPITQSFTILNPNASSTSTISITVDTDIDDFIYPKVSFTLGNIGGDISISNNTDDNSRLTSFASMPARASVIMKGETNYVTDPYYENFLHRNFVRLLDGENSITVLGNISTLTIEFQNRRSL